MPHDKVRVVPVTTCPHTGVDLSQQPVVNYITHQVVGIECKRVVTNYELEVRYGPAYGGLVSAPLPNGGKHYDNSIRSLATERAIRLDEPPNAGREGVFVKIWTG